MSEKAVVYPLPIYAAAAVWPVYALLLPLHNPFHFFLAAALSLSVGLIAKTLCRPDAPNPAAKAEEKPKEEKKPESTGNPELDKMISDGEKAIAEMRRLDDNIADEKISAAIVQLESISSKIFDHVKEHPEKLPQIRRFMDYYLPTTLKILNSYDRMDSQGVAGENISGSMTKIEQMMDTVVTAFATQLDSLFGADALDISTDITVLENMMAREGLVTDEIHNHVSNQSTSAGDDSGDIKLTL